VEKAWVDLICVKKAFICIKKAVNLYNTEARGHDLIDLKFQMASLNFETFADFI
jgi:hypothetical protein